MSNPSDDVLVPEWNKPEPFFAFPSRRRRKRTMIHLISKKEPLRVLPDEKTEQICRKAGTRGSLLRVYPNAIEIGRPLGEANKHLRILAFIAGVSGAVIGGHTLFTLNFSDNILWTTFLIIMGVLFLLAGIFFFRLIPSSVVDLPVIFNRKTRQVTFITDKGPHFFKIWQMPGYGEARFYSWDEVKARTYRLISTHGGPVPYSDCQLYLLWPSLDHPKRPIEAINLGFGSGWNDDWLLELWEHIRRYMEEDGPPIQPGDTPRKVDHSKLPDFPPDIIKAAGGPPLSKAEVTKLAQPNPA